MKCVPGGPRVPAVLGGPAMVWWWEGEAAGCGDGRGRLQGVVMGGEAVGCGDGRVMGGGGCRVW